MWVFTIWYSCLKGVFTGQNSTNRLQNDNFSTTDNLSVLLHRACELKLDSEQNNYFRRWWDVRISLTMYSVWFKMLTEHMHTAKHLSLTDNFKELQQYMEGVGDPDSKTCALKCFTSNIAIDAVRYISRSLFQHYRLYQHLFTEQQEEERFSIRVSYTWCSKTYKLRPWRFKHFIPVFPYTVHLVL